MAASNAPPIINAPAAFMKIVFIETSPAGVGDPTCASRICPRALRDDLYTQMVRPSHSDTKRE
jgi:hypothetical protein